LFGEHKLTERKIAPCLFELRELILELFGAIMSVLE
jgi:hypothetical protein